MAAIDIREPAPEFFNFFNLESKAMFTGIVEEMGEVQSLEERDGGWHMRIKADATAEGVRLGDSIAVNGVCLTIEEFAGSVLNFGLAPETLAKTNLGDMAAGMFVNLERSLPANGRIDGHFVQGHVDGTGTLVERNPDGDSLTCTVSAPAGLLKYIVPKGYIALDGTSLTVIDVLDDRFTFMLIAYTQQQIALPTRELGSRINLEVDILAKYAERFMAGR